MCAGVEPARPAEPADVSRAQGCGRSGGRLWRTSGLLLRAASGSGVCERPRAVDSFCSASTCIAALLTAARTADDCRAWPPSASSVPAVLVLLLEPRCASCCSCCMWCCCCCAHCCCCCGCCCCCCAHCCCCGCCCIGIGCCIACCGGPSKPRPTGASWRCCCWRMVPLAPWIVRGSRRPSMLLRLG